MVSITVIKPNRLSLTACTEAEPVCSRCSKTGVQCQYRDDIALTLPPVLSASQKGSPEQPLCITSQMHSMAVTSAQTDLESLLSTRRAAIDEPVSNLNTFRMLQHFQSVVSSALGCARTNHAMKTFVGSTAWDFPYLMHMVLAVSTLMKWQCLQGCLLLT